jgi:two-component system, NtrC family, response regulator
MSLILIIDDDTSVCRTLEALIAQHGHCADSAGTLALGLTLLQNRPVDLVLLDVHLPDGNSLDRIHQIAQSPSKPEIIIMTGQGDPDGAEFAIQSGAWDYIEKTATLKAITLRLLRALEYRAGKHPEPTKTTIDRAGIIGTSDRLAHALDQLAHTLYSDAGVLITGETGTGKELFAHAVHRNSPRSDKSFVVVDCAALPDKLVESMLFGHIKGAFTGADNHREGLVAQADGGTLFLDEIGEMPLELQKAFLRVLETRSFRPIGAKQERTSNFRIIASTNRDLDEMVQQGSFRKDLLYRLRTFHLQLPALRQRPEDIPALAQYHIKRLNTLYGWPTKEISPEFVEMLQRHDWPGNVRELVNTIDSALSAARYETVLFDFHLPAELRMQVTRKGFERRQTGISIDTDGALAPLHQDLPPLQNYREQVIEKAETSYLNALMSNAKGNITTACSMAGVSRSRLYEMMKKHAVTGKCKA